MIKIILTLLLLVGVVFAIREWKQSRLLAIMTTLLTATGMLFIWNLQVSDVVANFLGVGRGADLVLYTSAAISFILIVSLLIRIRLLHERLTHLSRAMALRDPSWPEEPKASNGRREGSGHE